MKGGNGVKEHYYEIRQNNCKLNSDGNSWQGMDKLVESEVKRAEEKELMSMICNKGFISLSIYY